MFPSIRRGQAVPRVLHFGCRVEADEGALISPMIDQRAVNRRLNERRRRAAEHRWRYYDFAAKF